MEAVVVGGGVAGAAAALALDAAGIGVRVLEAAPQDAVDAGAFLVLAGNGMRALHQLGVSPTAGFRLETARFLSADGVERAVSALDGHLCLRRAELVAELRAEMLRRGLRVEHDARFAAASQDGDGVSLRLADGREVHGDLLLGADGLNSAVRAQIDPGPPRYVGQQVFYGTGAEVPHEPGRIEMITGSAVNFGYAVSPQRRTFWFARLAAPPLDPGEPAASRRARLLAALRPDATPAADVVEAADEVLATNARDLVPLPRWRDGRMLLLGDAAHAASPATGQGAAMALEDAVLLGKALRDRDLDVYERLRRPRMERNAARSARMSMAIDAGHAERPEDVERLHQRHIDAPDDDPGELLRWDVELPDVETA